MRLLRVRYITLSLWIGIALVSLAIYLHIDAKIMGRPYYSEPLTFPISLERGIIWASHMEIYLSRKYDVVIDIEGRQLRDSAQWLNRDISWKLWDGTRLVADRSLSANSWQDYGGTLEGVVGSFEGQKGHYYSLVVQPNSEKLGPEVADATLKVQIPRDDWEGYLMRNGFEEVAAAVLAMFGGVMVLDWFFRHKEAAAPEDKKAV